MSDINNGNSNSPTQQDGSSSNTKLQQGTDWTAATIIETIAIFLLAGVCEIGGGWLVWSAVRESQPFWWALLGSAFLIAYGFVPTLQPLNSFGRVYAVYGGFFIILSFVTGWVLDGVRPDRGDWTGGMVALAGVLIILFWPR